MKVFICTFETKDGNADTETKIVQYLKNFTSSMRVHKNTWMIAADSNARKIRDGIKLLLDSYEMCFVAQLNSYEWAGWGTRVREWISRAREIPTST